MKCIRFAGEFQVTLENGLDWLHHGKGNPSPAVIFVYEQEKGL